MVIGRWLLVVTFVLFSVSSLSASSLDMALHPVETAKKAVVSAGVGFVAKKTGEAVYGEFKEYMEQNPDLAEEYLQSKMEFADKFFRYIDKHRSGVSAREFDILDKNIREGAVAIDRAVEVQKRNNNERCTPQSLDTLLLNPSEFDQGVNLILPKSYPNDTDVLSFGDVDSYYKTKKKKALGLHRDHIPSAATTLEFFRNRGFDLNKKSSEDLTYNASVIAIDEDLHRKTETYGGRNTSTRQNVDASNLRLASIRNMVFAAALVGGKYGTRGNKLSTYIYSALTLYERNSLLCLYQ